MRLMLPWQSLYDKVKTWVNANTAGSVTPSGAPARLYGTRGLGASRLAFARLLRPHGSLADASLPPAIALSPLPGLRIGLVFFAIAGVWR